MSSNTLVFTLVGLVKMAALKRAYCLPTKHPGRVPGFEANFCSGKNVELQLLRLSRDAIGHKKT